MIKILKNRLQTLYIWGAHVSKLSKMPFSYCREKNSLNTPNIDTFYSLCILYVNRCKQRQKKKTIANLAFFCVCIGKCLLVICKENVLLQITRLHDFQLELVLINFFLNTFNYKTSHECGLTSKCANKWFF